MAEEQTAEARIVCAAATGDPAAFAALEAEYRPLIDSMVKRFAPSIPELREEDLQQEVLMAFLKAVRGFSHDQTHVTFGLYAKIVIRNRLISLLRKQKTRRKAERLSPKASQSFPPEEKLLSSEQREQQLQKYCSILSPYEMQVFRLRLAGEKTSAIATRLGRSEKSVDNALSRLKAKIRRYAVSADPTP